MKMSSANISRTQYVSKSDVFALDRCNPGDPLHVAPYFLQSGKGKKYIPVVKRMTFAVVRSSIAADHATRMSHFDT